MTFVCFAWSFFNVTNPGEKIMKNKMTLSITLALSLLLSLVNFPSTANAQQPQRFKFATGVITPGMGQILRVTVATGDVNGDDIRARIGWMRYGAASCSGMPAVCRHMIESQGVTATTTLSRTDAISFDVTGDGNGVNVVVESNSRNARVLGIVFDISTQRSVAVIHPFSDF